MDEPVGKCMFLHLSPESMNVPLNPFSPIIILSPRGHIRSLFWVEELAPNHPCRRNQETVIQRNNGVIKTIVEITGVQNEQCVKILHTNVYDQV